LTRADRSTGEAEGFNGDHPRKRRVHAGASAQICRPDLGNVMFNELRIVGDLMYKDNFPAAMKMVSKSHIDTKGLITKVFKLEEIDEAFRQIIDNKDKYLKCLVEP
jgi:threonine dehydrogenase-like Zn-dependent dehydrogenase